MKYTEQELNDMIDGLLRYCNVSDKLSNKEKLKILKDIKINLEIDSEYAYGLVSDMNDKEKLEKLNRRMNANNMAIKEINMCINYLIQEVKKEKRLKREKCLHFLKKCVKI